MKNHIIYIATTLLVSVTAISCREENLINIGGEGKMTLTTSILSDIKVVSRALEVSQNNDLASKTLIWITNSDKELVSRYEGVTEQGEELTLPSGTYFADGWVGDSIPAFGSWEEGKGKRYHSRQQFEIISGQTTPVNLVCGIRNTLVSLNFDDNISRVLKNIVFEVSLNDGITDGSHSVRFEGDNLAGKGYFMTNSRTDGFKWTLSGTDIDGKEFSSSGVYKDSDYSKKPFLGHATEYIFNINYNANQGDIQIGGVFLDIDVEAEPVEGTNEEVIISLPPQIDGLNRFDLTRPVLAEPGNVGRKSIHIIGSSTLKSVMCEGDIFQSTGYTSFDLLTLAKEDKQSLRSNFESKGINFVTYDFHPEATEDNHRPTNIRLNLEELFTNALPKGEYTLTISATDENSKGSSISVKFNITEAPGQLIEITDNTGINFTSATLTAEVTKPGDKMGFEVKTDASSRAYDNWDFIEGKLNGNILSANVNELTNGTRYLYRLVVDDYTSPEMTFETKAYPQLPNAGFEEWSKSSNVYLVYGSGGEMYWDSGNHGAKKAGINLTEPDESICHSGKYSIRMKSQFAGLGGSIGKFAAGNVFIGKYLKTDGTNGVLGWGRPFNSPIAPKALKAYVKYISKPITHTDVTGVNIGDMDSGIIYVALLTDETIDYSSTEKWPVVIKTKPTDRQLFDKNGSNVVAYGELKFSESTTGAGLIECRIPINTIPGHEKLPFKNIMVVASASLYGDYFTGGEGSTMWLDDLELVYE